MTEMYSLRPMPMMRTMSAACRRASRRRDYCEAGLFNLVQPGVHVNPC